MKKTISAALVIGAAAVGITTLFPGVATAVEMDGLYASSDECWAAIRAKTQNGTYDAPPFTYYCAQTPSGYWIITR
ncbi:hypothetical protein ATM97_00435 [Nocardia sp. MH4]|uniref:hypothetical protein n=1 Tax=unclassified Nocardia TaxID=2637762 RepID=UPI001C4F28B4|nr:hypothetical protein [Nocardia sp. MH4]MBW0269632.1 hypothetical protein [Nocardia sp. MH4]